MVINEKRGHMVELRDDALVFSFPEIHPDAVLTIEFQRTLRIPDDDTDYPLPPGLGRFPARHVDDFAERVSRDWLARGGVMLPMYQSEALWLNFSSPHGYPFAVKVATGKINAVTGDVWSDKLTRTPQDYLSIPSQPWLDGYCVEKGIIRQFVAMPLGAGYSVEEQLTGAAEHGGIQLLVHPLRGEVWRSRRERQWDLRACRVESASAVYAFDMGLAPGGRMRQEIYDDAEKFTDWDIEHRGRCFVHLANALVWRGLTGEDPPTTPATAAEYTRAGLPWFEYYGADARALAGAGGLKDLRSVKQLGQAKGDVPLPENESVDPKKIVELRAGLGRHEVRQGRF
ncbi:membrane protein [soil metagenome]